MALPTRASRNCRTANAPISACDNQRLNEEGQKSVHEYINSEQIVLCKQERGYDPRVQQEPLVDLVSFKPDKPDRGKKEGLAVQLDRRIPL